MSSANSSIDASSASDVVKPMWASDANSKSCVNCKSNFSMSRRRHHCRACGRVFCNDCSKHRHELPEVYGYKGKQRCCDACHLAILTEKMNTEPESCESKPDVDELKKDLKERVVAMLSEGDDGWVPKLDKKGVKIFIKKVSDSKLFLVKSTSVVDAPIEKVLTIYSDKDAWKVWQPDMKKCNTLEKVNDNEEFMYIHYKVPVISDRDACTYSWSFRGHVMDDSKTDVRTILTTSVKHPLCPKVKGLVRAQVKLGYTIIEPHNVDGKTVTRLESVFHTDPRGLIPPAVVNQGVARAVDQILDMGKYMKETDVTIPDKLFCD